MNYDIDAHAAKVAQLEEVIAELNDIIAHLRAKLVELGAAAAPKRTSPESK